MSTLVVASSESGAGKTTVCVGLLQWLRRRQPAVAYRRLLGPGAPEDAAFVARVLGRASEASPSAVSDALAAPEGGTLVVEASSLDDARAMAATGAVPLVVADYQSDGLVQAARASLAALGAARPLLLLNSVPDKGLRQVRQRVIPELADAAGTLGALPEDSVLRGLSVGDLARALDATILTAPDRLDLPVEAVMVAAMSDEGAEEYFRRRSRKVVVCGGDRPDVQLPALATDTSCMVLTEGYDPDPTVFEAADEQGVPLLKVQPGTVATLEGVSDALGAARFRQAYKVPRALAAIGENLDLAPLLAALDAASRRS